MTNIRIGSRRVFVAQTLAHDLLFGLPERWQHTAAVASHAEELAAALPTAADLDVLLVAAWLHDVGYGPAVRNSGFHPLDGARFLQSHGWPPRICALVAHHSGAEFTAEASGLQQALSQYPREESPTADALTYADQTTGPHGQRMTLAERLADSAARHGRDPAREAREQHLRAVEQRVQARLANRPRDT